MSNNSSPFQIRMLLAPVSPPRLFPLQQYFYYIPVALCTETTRSCRIPLSLLLTAGLLLQTPLGAAVHRAPVSIHHVLAIVDLPLHAPGGIPASLFRQRDVVLAAGGLVRALDVAGNEEADKEVGQGREVQHVEPDGEGLARVDDAGLGDVHGLGGADA